MLFDRFDVLLWEYVIKEFVIVLFSIVTFCTVLPLRLESVMVALLMPLESACPFSMRLPVIFDDSSDELDRVLPFAFDPPVRLVVIIVTLKVKDPLM